jgi:beta-galactosidase/beta-glucuronidase
MNQIISLNGTWQFCLDAEKKGLDAHFEKKTFDDTITLPGTVSLAQKGSRSSARETGFLTDPYRMEGYSWYKRKVALPFSDAA